MRSPEPGGGNSDYEATLDELDPTVTAAILAQAAFRGYRLRERLRRLPAREAEKQIKALHRNARGFRRVGLFLVFAGLYFSLVFYGLDVSFQRSVQQSLKDHLKLVHYGPDLDKTHHDVSSLADLHQWMQAFFLKTYSGTQVEHPCMWCAVKPPDDVCDACNFDLYDAQTGLTFPEPNNYDSHGDDGYNFATSLNGRRRRLTSSDGSESDDSASSFGSGSSSTSTSFSTRHGLSEECGRCLLGRLCVEENMEACEAALGVSSSPTSSSSAAGAAASSNTSTDLPVESSLASSSSSESFSSNFSALLDALDLEPVGGVRASGGYLSIENVSQCDSINFDVGNTESLGRFQLDLQVPYGGDGYVGDRNRIVGGMLVTFTRRARLSGDQCHASRDYYDVCLADEDDNKTTIVPPDAWFNFRPTPDLVYSEEASGYPVLLDVGGYNMGINLGYCTLLLMDHLDVIPQDEVRSVTVQLVTYNGNLPSAYGTMSIDFDFSHGGKVEMKELVTAYILKGDVGQANDRARWILGVVFTMMTFGMMWRDTKKWFRARRSKVKRNFCHCCCGFTFFVLILMNLLMLMVWLSFSETLAFETVLVQGNINDEAVLDSITDQILALQEAALMAAAYDIVFLLTTLAGLYRWIFQMLSFHARMSIVTDTLSRASIHLDHFLFVFFLVILVFSCLTWLLVGSSTVEFSTLESAWQSVTRISLGESENFYPQILAAQPSVGPVVVVLYQVLGIVLLLNVVIAILLEAYRGVVRGMRGEDTIFQSFVAFVGMTLCSLRTRIRWVNAWLSWRLAGSRSTAPHERPRRPSLKAFLQGSTGVYGVDGRLVVMMRRPNDRLTMEDRQLSFNCPRYITVTEMHALIKATPVPASVADRLGVGGAALATVPVTLS
eukprot:g11336.t1